MFPGLPAVFQRGYNSGNHVHISPRHEYCQTEPNWRGVPMLQIGESHETCGKLSFSCTYHVSRPSTYFPNRVHLWSSYVHLTQICVLSNETELVRCTHVTVRRKSRNMWKTNKKRALTMFPGLPPTFQRGYTSGIHMYISPRYVYCQMEPNWWGIPNVMLRYASAKVKKHVEN